MENKGLSRRVDSVKSDVESVISELVYEIEELEERLEKEIAVSEELRETIDRLQSELADFADNMGI